MNKLISHSLEETKVIATNWLKDITEKYKDSDKAIIVGLSGHLGSGKTAFVKLIAEIMGVGETVTSPTFVIMKIYETKGERFKRLIHIDAYRLEKPEEMNTLGLDKLISNPNNLIMIEWPENVGDALPKDMVNIRFEFIDEDTREISY